MTHSEPKDVQSSQDREPIIDDIVVLYHTLVEDRALRDGFEKEFSSLGPVFDDTVDRQRRKNAAIDNKQAVVLLHDFHWQHRRSSEAAKSAVDQFVATARDKPREYRTRLRPSPPKAEEMERARRRSTGNSPSRQQTPMGRMLVEKPQTAQFLGAGSRVTTLRSRMRVARRCLAWLSINFEVPFSLEHMVDYFKVRANEPCTRGNAEEHAPLLHFP